MENYDINHYVEKTYFDGTIETEQVKERNPLDIESDLELVSIRFFDKTENEEKINYSNYYYYGERKSLDSLIREYNILQSYRPGTNRELENTINELILLDKKEVILDYRINPLKPHEVFPNEGDMTIGEYRYSLSNKKVLKK